MQSKAKTIAKRARVRPRTQMVFTMEKFSSTRNSCISGCESDNCIRTCIEDLDGANESGK